MAKTKVTEQETQDMEVKPVKKAPSGPRVRGKAYQAKRALVDKTRAYSLTEAVKKVSLITLTFQMLQVKPRKLKLQMKRLLKSLKQEKLILTYF